MFESSRNNLTNEPHKPFVPFIKDGRELMYDNNGILYMNVGDDPIEKGLISPDGDNWVELIKVHEN